MDEPLITDAIKCQYDACVISKIENAYLPQKKISAGKYAMFVHKGSYSSILDTYDSIYGSWILNTNEEILDKAILEKYIKHDLNTVNTNDYITEIYIPIK